MGCVFSSVISTVENLKPLVGLVQLNGSVKHYETLRAKGFQAADIVKTMFCQTKPLVISERVMSIKLLSRVTIIVHPDGQLELNWGQSKIN